ncbi:MAG: bifunctional DNA-formamidopyrimidine glycosylase/DNA-(apurinic or apyrimidinic site) lyase [Myxococcota bacterium]
MPELPEVESVRRSLDKAGIDAPVAKVWRSRKKLRTGVAWRQENLRALQGAAPGKLFRRGKFLLWQLDAGGREPLGWLVHLGMSGRFTLADPAAPREPHTHVVVAFEDGREVRFVDPRRFGGMRVCEWSRLHGDPPLSELGPEPLEAGFDGGVLGARAGNSKRPLRDVLLDQKIVAGVGNIYANEALFEARLHPLLPARRLADSAWARLAEAVVVVLERGLANGGTTLRDYRDGDGRSGRNQHALRVYGRAGEPCQECGEAIRGFVLGGRGGAFCPKHQARPRARRVR